MARLTEANEVFTLIGLCQVVKLTERANVMYWQALTLISTASCTLAFLVINNLLSCLKPAASTVRLFATAPQWRSLTCALGMIICALTGKGAKQALLTVAAQLPGLALESYSAVVTRQLNRWNIARMVFTKVFTCLKRCFIGLGINKCLATRAALFNGAMPSAFARTIICFFVEPWSNQHDLIAPFARLLDTLHRYTHRFGLSLLHLRSIVPQFAGIGNVTRI
jgi:hypothetical protein